MQRRERPLVLIGWARVVISSALQERATTGNPYLGDPAESCPVCIEANCCAEEQACWSSLACLENGICSALCEGDASCLDACDTEHAAGVALNDADDACVDTNCATECAGL